MKGILHRQRPAAKKPASRAKSPAPPRKKSPAPRRAKSPAPRRAARTAPAEAPARRSTLFHCGLCFAGALATATLVVQIILLMPRSAIKGAHDARNRHPVRAAPVERLDLGLEVAKMRVADGTKPRILWTDLKCTRGVR